VSTLQPSGFWETQPSKAEELWGKIPVVGWAIAQALYNRRVDPISKAICKQLRERPAPPKNTFGEDPIRSKIGWFVLRSLPKKFGWPNHHFYPDDPIAIAAWAHEDGLDDVSFIDSIEREFGVSTADFVEGRWMTSSVADFVDCITDRIKK